ncbi:MAG TPA: hypothetical protein VKI20_02355 [Acidimicrobiales bacterium]|nr:hypothetical protein [Acidimicrobiales bacterium]
MSDRRDDEALLGALGRAVSRHDPVPESVVAAARGGFGMVSLEAELATLVYDSYLGDEDTRALVRARGGGRELTFEAPSLTVEVEVLTAERRLLGQLVPPGPGVVEIRSPEGSVTVEADHLGRFSARDVPAGPVSLRCRGQGGPPADTEWVIL